MAARAHTPDSSFQTPRASWVVRVVVATVVVAFGCVGALFGRQAIEGVEVVLSAREFAQTRGSITRATTVSEGQTHRPDIHFTYTVDGERYSTTDQYAHGSYKDVKLAAREAGRWKVGQAVPVYYDRDTPRRAALTRDLPYGPTLTKALFSLGFFIVAGIGVFSYWRSRKRLRVLAYAKHVEQQRQRGLEEARRRREARESSS